jgi:hypothetical protein
VAETIKAKAKEMGAVSVSEVGDIIKELEPFVITPTGHFLHLCDETVETRQQFFDERSGTPQKTAY